MRRFESRLSQTGELGRGASRWMMGMGLATTFLGFLALLMSVATTLLSVVLIGGLFLIAAIFQGVFAFTAGRWSGFWLHLFLSVLYGLIGLFLLSQPLIGAATLTVLLAFFFVASGIVRMVAALLLHFEEWGWAFFSGLVTSALGFYVAINLSAASLFLLGLILAVDLIFLGWHLTVFGFALRRLSERRQRSLQSAYT